MKRRVGRLTTLEVSRLARKASAGLFADGGNLYLQVSQSGVASWIFRYLAGGRERAAGLGPLHTVSLKEARDKALEYRKLRLEGIDPIEHRKAGRVKAALEAARAMSFRQCAERYFNAHRDEWTSAKHAGQWSASLEQHAFPLIGDLPVASIDTDLVVKVLEPIWRTKRETASRIRGRIEAILDSAKTRGYRQGENPARWKGHLQHLLAGKGDVEHHAALPFEDIPEFVARLRTTDGVPARALEFTILTAARSAEVLGATWSEMDFKTCTWTVPAERMKARREHRKPLGSSALAIPAALWQTRESTFVFPGRSAGRPLGPVAMQQVLQRMRASATVHGFRSSFRDWAAERTNFPHEVAEMALAHTVGDKVEAAYRRGDLFEKRRQLAEAWARYCYTTEDDIKIVPFRTA
jgi:integrase